MVEDCLLECGIVSTDPLVTFSKRHTPTPIGIAGGCSELFRSGPSLHLVSPCWALHPEDIAEIAAETKRLATVLPKARLVVLANTDMEGLRLSIAGAQAIVGNSTVFVDERIFKPMPAFDGSDAEFDAIYNARFEPYKRHELAKKTENLALIYDPQFDGSSSPLEPEIRKLLPHARFLNHEIGKGQHLRLSRETVAREVNRARVGLCLSDEEGSMRAAMEYLLCGLPIVTTRSAGGRDRYYHAPFVLVVRDDPDEVGAAVAELIARNLNKLQVREYIGRIVAFERRNLLAAINAIAREHFGISEMFTTPEPFIRAQPFTDPTSDWGREKIERAAKTLGIALPAVANSGAGMSTP
jgi:hypothetical protein